VCPWFGVQLHDYRRLPHTPPWGKALRTDELLRLTAGCGICRTREDGYITCWLVSSIETLSWEELYMRILLATVQRQLRPFFENVTENCRLCRRTNCVLPISNPHNHAYKQAIIRVRIHTYYVYICGVESFFSNHWNTQRIPQVYRIRGFIKIHAGAQHRSLSETIYI
jgi:hypothetical protein